jgi:endo-1,4-beta-xylanase
MSSFCLRAEKWYKTEEVCSFQTSQIISKSSIIMASFSSVAVAACAVVGAFASPLELYQKLKNNGATPVDSALPSIPTGTGTDHGFFYSWWTDGSGTGSYSNGAGGEYSLSWGGQGNVVGGKGWNPGSANRYDNSNNVASFII